MNVWKCDVCGSTSDEKPKWNERYEWAKLRLRAATDWRPNMWPETHSTWPGDRRWGFLNSGLYETEVHFCGQECMEEGLRELHDGSQIVSYEGVTVPAALLREHVAARLAADAQAEESS